MCILWCDKMPNLETTTTYKNIILTLSIFLLFSNILRSTVNDFAGIYINKSCIACR